MRLFKLTLPTKRLICVLLCAVLALGLLPGLEKPVEAATGYDRGYSGAMAGDGKIYAHGLDVSAWQNSGLNFQNFKNAGYKYVILRIGTSYGKDNCFEEYYRNAKAAGLDVGCYYYSYAASVADAKAEAQDVLNWMKGKIFEYPVYFDYEDPSQVNVTGAYKAQVCYAFMDILKANGYLTGLYSMASWLEQDWVTSSGIRNKYEGWVAHVYSESANTGITSGEFNHYHSRYSSRYGMLQYSWSTYVNGAGPFDANVSYKDYPAIVKQYGFNGYSAGSWVENACFDVMVYRDRNKDLAGKTDEQLKEHWLKFGIKEGRPSSTILDLAYYRDNNPDLKEAFGDDFTKLYNHFITAGYKEYRKSSPLFDGDYYVKRYPDVGNSYKDQYLRHYVQNGIYEGRRGSATFDPNYYWFVRPDVAEAWPGDYAMCARHYAGHGINDGVKAYDSENPVISDAVISDVSAQGYTVTCTVTDNWGISKVAFPSWTVENGQDDLAEDFINTQKGTASGDTYTFRVNASDHSSAGGQYVTHIYAVDKGGNQVSLELDPVEVKDAPVDKLQLADLSHCKIEGTLLKNVGPDTTVSTLLSQFKNENLKLTDSSGKTLSDTDTVGTGTTVCLYLNNFLVDQVTVVILGDLDGNGYVNTTDYLRIKAAFMREYALSEAETAAADVDGSGSINTTDYARVKAHFLKLYNLHG